jgi:hypothetical protein
MSSTSNSFFAQLDPIHRSHLPPTTSQHHSLLPSITTHDTDLLPSHFSPVTHSPTIQYSIPSALSPPLPNILEDIQTQIRSLSPHITRSTLPHPKAIQSLPISIDSRPQTNSNNLPDSRSTHPPSSPMASKYSAPSSSLPFHPPPVSIAPLTSHHSQSTSPFQPIVQSFSSTLPIITSHVLLQPTPIPRPAAIDNLASTPSIISSSLLIHVPPIITTPTSAIIHSNDAIPPLITPSVSLLPIVPSTSIPSTAFKMSLNNNLPTFKGLAHERPIQFINDCWE